MMEMIRCYVREAVDNSVHDFLFKLQEEPDFEDRIRLLVDGRHCAKISDQLHGELFSDDGWFERISHYGKASP